MAENLRSPQYLALQGKYDVLCEAIQASGSIAKVARKLKTRNLIGGSVEARAVNAAVVGQDLSTVVREMMQPVNSKVGFTRESFYDLVDVLDECEADLSTPIGRILEKECGQCVCVCARAHEESRSVQLRN